MLFLAGTHVQEGSLMMTQSTTNHPYQPHRSEQELLREVALLDRIQHQLHLEEQELPKLRTQWFASRVSIRNQRFQQEVARLRKESEQRGVAALPRNLLFVLTGKGHPSNTHYQEETFLLRSIENLRQQMTKQDECDLSWISHREQDVIQKRLRLQADTSWLQQEYQRHLQGAHMQQQRDWLLRLCQWYPAILSAPVPTQGPSSSNP